MIHIIYFIIGFLLGIIGVNIIASFGELVTTALDALRSKIGVYIAKRGAEITEITGDNKADSRSHAIGFEIPQELEYYEDEDDD